MNAYEIVFFLLPTWLYIYRKGSAIVLFIEMILYKVRNVFTKQL